MKPVELHPQAELELAESVAFYNSRVLGLGDDFLSAVKLGCSAIQKDPARRCIRHDGTRKLRLHRFPYFLIYRDEPTKILIVAIAHGARRPGYWRKRI